MTSPPISPCPYRGLLAFREEDAPFFFGREAFTQELVLAVQKNPLVSVIGSSGSGKTSVVFAGLIPCLRREGSWHIIFFRPSERPLHALATAIIPLLEPDKSESDQSWLTNQLVQDFQQDVSTFQDVVKALVGRDSNIRLLLVVDQFEELYSLCQDVEERQYFLTMLLEAVNYSPNFSLVITLRADFLGYALSYRPLADALQYTDLKIGSMKRKELKDATEKPAQRLGVQIEEGLMERILEAVAEEPGSLPSLQFTLKLLWQRQTNCQLTHQAYEEIGGVKKALAGYAEIVYQQLSETDRQRAQRVFLQLVHLGEGTEDTRRSATRAEIGEDNWNLVERLVDDHLVIISKEVVTEKVTVEIIHEAVIQEWGRLRGWIEINRGFRIWQERLRTSLHHWEGTDKDEEALLRGIQLTEAEDWLKKRPNELSKAERDFIQLSMALRKRKQAKRKQEQRMARLELLLSLFSATAAWVSLLPVELGLAVIILSAITAFLFLSVVLWRLFSHIRNTESVVVPSDSQVLRQAEQQIALNARELESCVDVNAIRNASRRLTIGELEGPASALLRSFSSISEDVDAALNQGNAYKQRLALKPIADRLDSLLRELTRSSDKYAVPFRQAATRWCQIVTDYMQELAKKVEQLQEIDSPYVIGVPLTEQQEIFVGRDDIGSRIEQLLLDRRRPPLLLYGQRRMGKTSLLYNLGRLLPNTIIPMFVDLQGPASRASDYSGFIYNIAKDMVKSAKKQAALTLPSLTREALATDPFTYFDEWLDNVEQALGQNTALLAWDEFEALDKALTEGRFSEAAVLGMLRNLIQHRPRFKVLLSGSHTIEEFQRWASYLINVQVVHISYLKEVEARKLIVEPVKDFALRYEPDAVERVLQLTRCHPFLVQLLCAEIVALKNEQDPSIRRLASLADVEEAVSEALSSGSFFFADIDRNQVDAAGLAILRFLAAKGEGATVSQETLCCEFPDNVDSSLDALLRRDLIEPVGDCYRFQVELIRRWFAKA